MLSNTQWRSLSRFPAWLAGGYLVVSIVYILFSDRLLSMLVQDVDRITRIQSYKGWAFVSLSALLIFVVSRSYLRSLKHAEESLERARLDYGRLIETTREGVQVLDGEGRTIFVNDRMCELAGVDRERLLRSGLDGVVAPSNDEGTTVGADEMRLCPPSGGEVWTIVTESPVTTSEGERTGTLRLFTDNTARRRALMELSQALRTQRVLMSELDHRVRNNLASLVAIIEVSAAGKPEMERFAGRINDRVRVMASGYTLLSRNQWRPVTLESLVGALTMGDSRCRVSGPAVFVGMEQVVPLMLVIFELLSNAREHGSLRVDHGTVDVTWRRSETEGEVVLDWIERAGPPVREVRGPGFGLAVAVGIASSELRGGLEWEFAAEGAKLKLRMSTGPSGSATHASGKGAQVPLHAAAMQ